MMNPGYIETLEAARYMRAKFSQKISQSDVAPDFPDSWSLEKLLECHQLVNVLVSAYMNKKTLSWSADDYMAYLQEHGPRATGRNPEFERRVSRQFPRLVEGEPVLELDPFVLCDSAGNILMWYLPGALKEHRQTSLWKGFEVMEESFRLDEYSTSWRLNQAYYMKPEECSVLMPGTVSLSPAWFQQGHSKTDPLEVSAELRKECGLAWIETFKETASLIGAAFSIMHPEQFDVGIRVLELLNADPSLVAKSESFAEILKFWASPFTALSIINNRTETPVHRDTGSAYQWMDLLATVGAYIDGFFKVPGVGLNLPYSSGTLIAVAGRILGHGATSSGERACVAQYMKDSVVKELLTEERGWSKFSALGTL